MRLRSALRIERDRGKPRQAWTNSRLSVCEERRELFGESGVQTFQAALHRPGLLHESDAKA